jgi:hypothetical protein
MAGDWIKWTCGLLDKPEVIRMAVYLRTSREVVVCRLMKFWEWCDANIPDSSILDTGSAFVELSPDRGDNVAFVDALVGTPGFADSLAAVDWIRFRDGRVELPNFGRHNGETAKTRARNAKNQKKKRQRGGGVAHDPERLRPPPPPPETSPLSGDKTVTRGEERREEKPTASHTRPRTPRKAKPPNPDHQPAVDGFCSRWLGAYGSKYVFNGGKDADAVAWMLGQVPTLADLFAVFDRYLADRSEFVVKARHNLAVLRSQFVRWAVDELPAEAKTPPAFKTKAQQQADYFGRQAAQAFAATPTPPGGDW